MNKKERAMLEDVLYHSQRAMNFLLKDDIAIMQKASGVSADVFYSKFDDYKDEIYSKLNKRIGSDITGFYIAVDKLKATLNIVL